jgi:hypothetical protein
MDFFKIKSSAAYSTNSYEWHQAQCQENAADRCPDQHYAKCVAQYKLANSGETFALVQTRCPRKTRFI